MNDDAWDRLPERARAERRADGRPWWPSWPPSVVNTLPSTSTGIVVPVVLGRGSRSLPHHRQAIDALVELLPTTEIIEIPGAAHGAHLSHPDAFAAFVRRVAALGAGRRAMRREGREPAQR